MNSFKQSHPFLERSVQKMKHVFHFLKRSRPKNETRGPIFETDSMAKYVQTGQIVERTVQFLKRVSQKLKYTFQYLKRVHPNIKYVV